MPIVQRRVATCTSRAVLRGNVLVYDGGRVVVMVVVGGVCAAVAGAGCDPSRSSVADRRHAEMEYAHMTISTMIVMNAARSGSAQRHTSHVYVGGGVCGGDGAIISVRLTTNTSVMRVGGGTVVDGGAGAVGVESGQPGASK